MRIAVIGTGIAGMVAAHRLSVDHDITVFEAGDYIGGHTNTVDVDTADGPLSVDTGFIVFNDRTYPNFVALMDELGVASQPSEMSFSVSCQRTGVEYNGHNLDTLFAQRRNLLRPSFHRMIADILKFNREGLAYVEAEAKNTSWSLGDFLYAGGYRQAFVEQYLIPMGAAIWSTDPVRMFEFPAEAFLRFFRNHGLLSIKDRPQWRTITGGSQRYVERLTANWRDRVRLSTPVEQVRRTGGSVLVSTRAHGTESFDHVFIACHSDQALGLLADPSDAEREILAAIPYQRNEAVLHTDTRMLPRTRKAWASWNYRLTDDRYPRATLTYNMNILQRLSAQDTYCVTLNDHENAIDESKVIYRTEYDHPLFLSEGLAAQKRLGEINGQRGTWFCGAYWGYGFHEDGVKSGLTAVDAFEAQADAELHLRRAG